MAPKPRYQELVEKVKKLEKEAEELRQTETSLRESLERYRALFDHAADLIAVVDSDGNFLDLNERFEHESGYARKEMIGKSAFTSGIMTPQSAEVARSNLRKMREGEPWMIFEIEGVRKNGIRIPFELRVAPLKRNGEIVAFQAILRDIRDRKRVVQALRESEERFRNLSEAAEEGIFIHEDGNILEANEALAKMFGYDHSEIIGMSGTQLATRESWAACVEGIAKGYSKPMEVACIRKDGSTFYGQVVGRPYPYRGKTARVAILRDVTEIRKTEQGLRESEEKYRHLVNHAPAGIYEVDYSKQKFVTVNDVMCEYTGYAKEEFLSLSPLEILSDESRNRFLQRIAKISAGEKVPETVEYQIRAKGGREFWVILNTKMVYENGKPRGATVVVHDITERKLAEEALRKSEERYRLLVDNASEGIFIAQDGRLKFPNPKTLETLGYTEAELKDISYEDLLHPDDRRILQEGRTLSQQGLPSTYSVRVLAKTGEQVWVEISAVPIFWEGRPAALGFVRDITTQKRLEAQLLQAQKMEAIGTIASGVAHNFRNILTVISMKSQLLRMKYRHYPAVQEIAQGIHTYVDRGVQLVEGLMQFCRSEPKREFRKVDLATVIRETYQLITKSFDRVIEIQMSVPESLLITGDPSGLTQVLMNLCTNARDAMPRGGQLRIEARKEEERAVVTVGDTGLGMDKKTMEKCFDPFFTTKDPGKGTGLGLSTTYGIVNEHGGEIRVISELGAGTTFVISFPLASAVEQAPVKAGAGVIQGRGQKVLVIDDEEEICRLMEELLEGFGYRVGYATNGREGVERCRRWGPDIVLLDRNLPELDGLTCCEEIVKHNPQAKVVIMSGYDEASMEEEKRRLIKGYLTKPVDIIQLTKLLSEVCK
jgi:PAS domain S-box-containing protein